MALFIGLGLLRLSRGWWTCALVSLWIAMVGIPLTAIYFLTLTAPKPLDYTLFGQKIGQVSKEFGIVLAALMFPLAVWQYWVLTRPDVRRLFGVPRA